MEDNKPYLSKTTFHELALFLEESEMSNEYWFCSTDPERLKEYNLDPFEYYSIGKRQFSFQDEDQYVIMICYMDGTKLEAQSIDIISHGYPDDEDERVEGIADFLEEYYQKYMVNDMSKGIYIYINNH